MLDPLLAKLALNTLVSCTISVALARSYHRYIAKTPGEKESSRNDLFYCVN